MSEIEKLYENAGIEPTCRFKGLISGTCQNFVSFYYNEPCQKEDCKNFSAFEKIFTAEKQLELIKWLGKRDYTIRIDFHENEWGIATEDNSGYFQDSLPDALASIINTLWQDLTPEEKAEIKDILEDKQC